MICQLCNAEFVNKTDTQKFCSKPCYRKAKGKRANFRRIANKSIYDIHKSICSQCNIEFSHRDHKAKFCTLKCSHLYHKKYLDIPDCLENPNRKIDKRIGYVRIYVPMHKEANTWGYVYEHRIIAEQMIGRELLPNEVVHHKNGIRHDNSPENLEVMDAVEHNKLGKKNTATK